MLVVTELCDGAVAELADATDLKSGAFGREGSNPSGPTYRKENK